MDKTNIETMTENQKDELITETMTAIKKLLKTLERVVDAEAECLHSRDLERFRGFNDLERTTLEILNTMLG